ALRRLRALELVLFGMTIAFFVTIHYRLVPLRVAEGGRGRLMAAGQKTRRLLFGMSGLYGRVSADSCRRAAAGARGRRGAALRGAMGGATIVSALALRALHPEVYVLAAPLLTFEIVSENVLMLAIGAGVTIYATYIINALRVEAFEARQLNQYQLKGLIGAG